MKPTFEITPDLFDNEDQFPEPFFQQFTPKLSPAPLQLTDTISKHYKFPTFYNDVTCAIAAFMCDYGAAKKILPHPEMNPVKMPGGRALVIFSCYEYKKVMGVAPYNEIAMTIPIMMGNGFSPPLLPLILKVFKNFGYHVFSMPVTSEENRIRGVKIWGLPKVTEEINISTEGEYCTTVAKDAEGVPYFELAVPKAGKPKKFNEKGFLYSLKDKQLLKAQTNFAGDFNMRMNFQLLWNKGASAAIPVLKLGDSPRAAVLKSLQLEENAFQFRYAQQMTSCFDLPL